MYIFRARAYYFCLMNLYLFIIYNIILIDTVLFTNNFFHGSVYNKPEVLFFFSLILETQTLKRSIFDVQYVYVFCKPSFRTFFFSFSWKRIKQIKERNDICIYLTKTFTNDGRNIILKKQYEWPWNFFNNISLIHTRMKCH